MDLKQTFLRQKATLASHGSPNNSAKGIEEQDTKVASTAELKSNDNSQRECYGRVHPFKFTFAFS